MKFNWGTGIMLTLIAFAALMTVMVRKAMQQDFDLVSENYYEEELVFQEVIDQRSNTLGLSDKASIVIEDEEIFIQLPYDFEGEPKDVKVHMYYEPEADYDFRFEHQQLVENRFKINFPRFTTGKWIAKVKVNFRGVDYLLEPEIVL